MSLADELRGLAELRDQGILTPEEFESQKALLLDASRPQGPAPLPPGQGDLRRRQTPEGLWEGMRSERLLASVVAAVLIGFAIVTLIGGIATAITLPIQLHHNDSVSASGAVGIGIGIGLGAVFESTLVAFFGLVLHLLRDIKMAVETSADIQQEQQEDELDDIDQAESGI